VDDQNTQSILYGDGPNIKKERAYAVEKLRAEVRRGGKGGRVVNSGHSGSQSVRRWCRYGLYIDDRACTDNTIYVFIRISILCECIII